MTVRVPIKSEILSWARERSRLSPEYLLAQFPKIDAWERGESHPTLKQLEKFANATHTPIGYLFLAEPPVETLPIPDFRTIGSTEIARPSPDLLETVYLCQQRQEWYREYARQNNEEPVPFIGTLTTNIPIEDAASQIGDLLSFHSGQRGSNWSEAFHRLLAPLRSAGGVPAPAAPAVRPERARPLVNTPQPRVAEPSRATRGGARAPVIEQTLGCSGSEH